ncbi:MAG: SsrA-binding protein SmpB [Pseudomonadales bacterium]
MTANRTTSRNDNRSKGKAKPAQRTIALNKRARHEYTLEEVFEAGIALEGWEVKSLRAGRAQLVDSYVLIRNGEAWLLGANISPLASASTHVIADPQRTRKLLLHAREIARIHVATQQKGYACVATALYWKGNRIKCEVALARGKKLHDKRATSRERDWSRQKERLLKNAG